MPAAPVCFTSCTPDQLIGLPNPDCSSTFRQTTPIRFGLYNCDITLPTGSQSAIDAAMLALYESGDLVFTNRLFGMTFDEPTYEDIGIDDCRPPIQVLQQRAINFEDRYIQDVSGVSPFVADSMYDYTYWLDKLVNQGNIRWLMGYCDNNFRKIDFIGSLRGFVDYIKPSTQGAVATETKKFRALFNGDPLSMTNKVFFNATDAGIIF